jgi:hypothetical protein
MDVNFAYAQPSTVAASLAGVALDFAANLRRPPVAFRGRVVQPVLLRQLLFALHDVIRGDFRWVDDAEWSQILDPVITVHPDQLFFEAFSSDESVYGRLSAPLEAFEPEEPPQFGTTNIDFTWGLREALQLLRSSRPTVFAVGAQGFGVVTQAAGTPATHFERKVDVPDGWVKGFLQVQAALAMRPFTFDVRPVDLLTCIAFFQDHKPPRPPYGLRYEFEPGQPIRIVLEPWEERITLKGTHYDGYSRTVRLWGRRRLELLRGILPYAERVTVGVLGRALPHFYICHCGPYQFVLALSGWTQNDWSKGSALELLAPRAELDPEQIAQVYRALAGALVAPPAKLAQAAGLPRDEVEQALFLLCRAGRAIFDPTTRAFRLRELFAEPLDPAAWFLPDPRLEDARELLAAGRVAPAGPPPDATEARRHETRGYFTVSDDAPYAVTVSVDRHGRLRFGRCTCPFFQDNLMARGPCPHILAARLALDSQPIAAEDWPRPPAAVQ